VSIWNYLPTFDGQTIFTSVVGGLFSLVTFIIGYKKTVGARQERFRAANQELIASVLRRVAVEREVMDATQFQYIREAKAYRTSTPIQQLVVFDAALSVVLSEIIDNNFLDQPSKNAIIDLLAQSRKSSAEVSSQPLGGDSQLEQGPRALGLLSLGVAGLGAAATGFLSNYVKNALDAAGAVADRIILEWIPIVILTAALSGVAVFLVGYFSAYVENLRKRNGGKPGAKVSLDGE